MPLALVDETFESSKLFSADQPPEVKQGRGGFPEPAPPPTPSISAPLLAVFTAISSILAARLILLLASGGAFVLFCIAALHPAWGSWGAAVAYAVTVLIPLTAYSVRAPA